MNFLKNSACSESLSRNFKYATPTIAEKMTTAMVDVERLPVKSANTFVGMKLRSSCGMVSAATVSCLS